MKLGERLCYVKLTVADALHAVQKINTSVIIDTDT